MTFYEENIKKSKRDFFSISLCEKSSSSLLLIELFVEVVVTVEVVVDGVVVVSVVYSVNITTTAAHTD